MDILSVQSAVLHGMVGNNAAVPVLQSLGWAPLALHTTWYSHHKGHPGWCGDVTPLAVFASFLQYVWQAPHLQVRTVLSGYLGSAAQAGLLAQSLPEGVFYACDPVMGDAPGGQYVSDAIVQIYRERLIPRATVLLPNQFELGLLAGCSVQTPLEAIDAAHGLLARYPGLHMVSASYNCCQSCPGCDRWSQAWSRSVSSGTRHTSSASCHLFCIGRIASVPPRHTGGAIVVRSTQETSTIRRTS